MEPTNKKGHKHKQEYKGGRPFKHDIEGILGRADFEIARLKKIESSSTKSLFRNEEYKNAVRTITHGNEYKYFDDPTSTVSVTEWEKAFKRFCKKKVNIYGQKVDRSRLFKEYFIRNKKCQD